MSGKYETLKSIRQDERFITDYACQMRACDDLEIALNRELASFETTRSAAREQRELSISLRIKALKDKRNDAERELNKLTREDYRYGEYINDFSLIETLPGGWND